MGLVCDGLAANRKLFKLHAPEDQELVYCVPNPYTTEKRPFYFLSDPPHLVKTVRNAWANKRRDLEVNCCLLSLCTLMIYHRSIVKRFHGLI
jgi:hypothetical protein